MPRIVRKPGVARDVEAILEYLAPQNLEAAIRLLDELERLITRLARNPGMGARPTFLMQERHADVRYQLVPGFPNYLVFYRPIRGGIEILHIFHGARDIPEIFEP